MFPSPTRQLPLITKATRPKVNHKTALAQNIEGLNTAEIVDAYYRSIARAPQRPLVSKPFLRNHDGKGGAAASSRMKVAAKAIYNSGQSLLVAGESVIILGYEVPLRARQADKEIGEIDLLGLDTTLRPWVIELKVAPNAHTPLKALYQGLRYSAILDANRRALAAEIRAHSHGFIGGGLRREPQALAGVPSLLRRGVDEVASATVVYGVVVHSADRRRCTAPIDNPERPCRPLAQASILCQFLGVHPRVQHLDDDVD